MISYKTFLASFLLLFTISSCQVRQDDSEATISFQNTRIAELGEHLEEKKALNAEAEKAITDDLEAQTAKRASLFKDVFKGMTNVITNALSSTENIFQAFGKFFGDFIKGMLIKIAAMTVAALALVVVM